VPITVSIGIASFGVDPGEDIDQLLEWRTTAFIWPRTTTHRICVNDEGKTTFA